MDNAGNCHSKRFLNYDIAEYFSICKHVLRT